MALPVVVTVTLQRGRWTLTLPLLPSPGSPPFAVPRGSLYLTGSLRASTRWRSCQRVPTRFRARAIIAVVLVLLDIITYLPRNFPAIERST